MAGMIHEEIEEFCEKKMKGKKNIEISGLFTTSAVNIIWSMISGKRFEYANKDNESIMSLLQELFRGGNVTGGILIFPKLKNFISLFYEFPSDTTNDKLVKLFNVSTVIFLETHHGNENLIANHLK